MSAARVPPPASSGVCDLSVGNLCCLFWGSSEKKVCNMSPAVSRPALTYVSPVVWPAGLLHIRGVHGGRRSAAPVDGLLQGKEINLKKAHMWVQCDSSVSLIFFIMHANHRSAECTASAQHRKDHFNQKTKQNSRAHTVVWATVRSVDKPRCQRYIWGHLEAVSIHSLSTKGLLQFYFSIVKCPAQCTSWSKLFQKTNLYRSL